MKIVRKTAKERQKKGFCATPEAINLLIYNHLLASFALLPPPESLSVGELIRITAPAGPFLPRHSTRPACGFMRLSEQANV